jgi:predicted metal-dependent hydrolase
MMEKRDDRQPAEATRPAGARPWRVVNRRTPPTPEENPAARCGDPPPEGLLVGIEQFNRREFFECHETLEAVWNAEPGLIRVLYKGILQVGVGCYHLLRGNYRGALIKLQSGADYLEPYAPQCMGIEVGRLIADARRLRAEVERLGPEHLDEIDLSLLPVIRMR